MEQLRNMNLPIVGRIQHGEQQISNQRKKVVELGYFIAKIKNDNMQFLLNRFNEKYKQEKKLNIRFFDDEPLSVRHIRYNQGGAVCYCKENEVQGKQKVSNVWKTVNCSEDCKYRLSSDGTSKPMCNLEGTLKFLLPEISTDRIWIMKITGQTSIQRLKAYIALQKHLGNPIIGDYTLFLKQEEQTNKMGKTFNNYVLDIVKKEDFISNDTIPSNQANQKQLSTITTQNVDNTTTNSNLDVVSNQEKESKSKETKTTEKKSTKKVPKEKKQETITQDETKKKPENTEPKNEFENYYVLVDTGKRTLMKAGKPTVYLIGNFVDMKDQTIDVVIPPQFADELSQCDIGTTVILDLATVGDKTFTNNIQYVQKCLKNVAA